MNQSDINDFLLCLSRMTATEKIDQDRMLYQHYNVNSSLEFPDSDHGHDHDHDDHDHDESHNIVVAKATAMLVLFCATSLCGATPFFLNRHFKWTDNNTNAPSATVVKCLLYFGGGVLLCTTFLHLLPEVRETVESLQECGTFPQLAFPFVELLMCCGFFIMFLIEELIHCYIHKNRKILNEETVAFERGHSIRHSYMVRNGDGHQEEGSTQMWGGSSNESPVKTLSPRDLYPADMENQKHQHNDHQISQQPECPAAPAAVAATQENTHNLHSHSHSHNHHQHSHHLPLKGDGDDDIIASSLRGLLIVLALSVHELFEGLAIGLEGSANNVWFMFAAVSAHKLVLAFCVGVELIVARTRTHLSVIFVFTFAIVSPIGIGIGMLISTHDATASSIPSAILQGLACGTLLYVVFFEILSKDRSGLLAYIALIVGFGFMFGLQQIVSGHQHNHGCHSESHSHSHSHSHMSDPGKRNDDNRQGLSLEKQLQILREASSSLKQILKKN